MADILTETLADVDHHRFVLEQNILRLRESLQLWQAWELEYEGMKEEIHKFKNNINQSDLESLANSDDHPTPLMKDNLLTTKERSAIVWDEKGNLRSYQQILSILSRRIDYVQRNISTIDSQLRVAEKKYAASQVLDQFEVRNDEGLPLTEIVEELDEEGNVLSGKTSEPGHAAPQVVEALRKAGIKELPKDNDLVNVSRDAIDKGPENPEIDTALKTKGQQDKEIGTHAPHFSVTNPKVINKGPAKPRKSVSFAQNTKEGHSASLNSQSSKTTKRGTQQTKANQPKSKDTIIWDQALGGPRSNITVYDADEDLPFEPIIPENESLEDAALRREMIQYNMGEVGAIVAELDLDENAGSDEGSDDYDDDDYDSSSVEEGEDEHGRSTRRVLKDDYLKEMRQLEQKLKNIGPTAAHESVDSADGSVEDQTRIKADIVNADTRGAKPPVTKAVRFAGELDIQEKPVKGPSDIPSPDSIRTNTSDMPRKPIHAATIIERPYAGTTSPSKAAEPEEFDPALIRQEVSTEYYRMRNQIIQQQGGFATRDDMNENGEVPLTEAEGGPKKMSRFKAARLGKLSS